MMDNITKVVGAKDVDLTEVVQIPIDRIKPSPYQPRSVFNEAKIEELCQTIKTHGIIQPIVVRVVEGSYEIIAGERRYRAMKKIGARTIPAIIKEYSESQTASIALIENLQREGLTAIEEAKAYSNLIELHNLTQESLAQRLGKNQSTIANKLRLLNLPKVVQDELLNRKISERHARALLSLKKEEEQEKVLKEIINKDLNVKQTESRIKSITEKDIDNKKEKPKKIAFSRDTRIAVNTIRQSINMIQKTGLSLESEEIDYEDYYEFVIKLPKHKK